MVKAETLFRRGGNLDGVSLASRWVVGDGQDDHTRPLILTIDGEDDRAWTGLATFSVPNSRFLAP